MTKLQPKKMPVRVYPSWTCKMPVEIRQLYNELSEEYDVYAYLKDTVIREIKKLHKEKVKA